MTDDAQLAAEITHLKQRLNQALGKEIEYQDGGVERDRLLALAELEAVGEEIEQLLAEYDTTE